MRPVEVLNALFLARVCTACAGGHDDDQEWTRDELAELEAKWGEEVWLAPLSLSGGMNELLFQGS